MFDEPMISRFRALLVGLGLLVIGQGAAAGPTKAVVELFTSQGCSSCPPADAVLVEMARRPDMIALTFPVDYWDYLGWKDTLAHPLFTARQRGYAHGRGDRQVYTPQIIVNGERQCVGSDRAEIEQAVQAVAPELPIRVTAEEKGSLVVIDVSGPSAGSSEVWVLPVLRLQAVSIDRGENRGRTITYANVVRSLIRVGAWSGGPARFETPLTTALGEGDGYVVLVQSLNGKKPGPILGAAKSPNL